MTDYTITPWPDKSFFSGDIPFPEKAAAKPHVIEMSEKIITGSKPLVVDT